MDSILTELKDLGSYERMKILYEKGKGKTLSNDKYDAEVCGFHYKWDDNDRESIIVKITKVKTHSFRGINYRLNGDIIRVRGDLGYWFINIFDAEKLGLFNDRKTMTLGFKTQIKGKPTNFVEKILAGEKVTTIRVDAKGRWKVGNKVHFATGVRTKNHNQFAEGVCTKVDKIEIQHSRIWIANKWVYSHHVFINDSRLNEDEVKELAKCDGFDSVDAFFEWFNKDFEGKIIHFKVNQPCSPA